MSPTRRSLLALLGTLGTAGCTGLADSTETASPTDSPTSSPSPSPTPPRRAALSVLSEWRDRELVVYPKPMARWLRDAAAGATVRAHAPAFVVAPDPLLPAIDQIRLRTPDGDVDGVYDVTAEGGARYELLLGADRADPPADTEVTPVSELSERRRDLAKKAIAGSNDARVYPETVLGEWARHEWMGGYYRADGTVYRGKEVQQTDAAFFSEEVWCVLSLSPAEPANPVTLRVAEVPASLRDTLDPALQDWRKHHDAPTVTVTAEGREFVRDVDALATYTHAFDLSLGP